MIASITASTVLTDVRTVTDQDNALQVTDAMIFSWITAEYRRLRRRLSEIAPELYVATPHDFTLAGTTYQYDLAANVATLDKPLSVSWLVDGCYVPMRVAEYELPELSTNAVAGSYRLYYLPAGGAITAGGDFLELPQGASECIVQRVAAKVRMRVEEDPSPHLALARESELELREEMSSQYRATPRTIIDAPDPGVRRRWRVRRTTLEVLA